jgi:hypothetical protein
MEAATRFKLLFNSIADDEQRDECLSAKTISYFFPHGHFYPRLLAVKLRRSQAQFKSLRPLRSAR